MLICCGLRCLPGLEDAASAKMAAEELRRENAALRKKVDDLHRRSLTSEA